MTISHEIEYSIVIR